jgi:integrase
MNTDIIPTNPSLFESTFVIQVFGNLDVSAKTREDYLYRITRFKEFVHDQRGMNRNTLLDYKRSLSLDSTISVSTKIKYLVVAKVFVQQLYRLGVITVDISTGVKSFKLAGGFKTNGFTDTDIDRIMEGLKGMKDCRLKAILSLKMFGGFRDIEIVRLTVENIDLERGIIHVHGKGRDGEESLPILSQVVTVLGEYITTTGKRSGPLFTSQSKRNNGQRLTTKTVWMMVRDFLDRLGISQNPHQFRSFFTTNLVKRMGSNLFDVIVYTRHRNIQTLQSYVNQINKERTLPKFEKAFSDFLLT